jgi:hypothetical protein
MYKTVGAVCLIACALQLGGCSTGYLVDSRVFQRAQQTAAQLRQAGRGETPVAVSAQPLVETGPQPPRYVLLSALRVEPSPLPVWRATARDRKQDTTAGGILLGLGLAALGAGAAGLYMGVHPPCTSGDTCFGQMYLALMFGTIGVTAGVVMSGTGAALLAVGAPPTEVRGGQPGVVYVSEPAGAGSSGALPAAPLALATGLRF